MSTVRGTAAVALRTASVRRAGEIAPVEPLGYLQLLVEATRERAQRLSGLARNSSGTDSGERILEEVERLTEQMDHLDELLDEP